MSQHPAPGAARQLQRWAAMKTNRSSRTLIRWSGVLATFGVLIFVAAVCFLATALWHYSLIRGYVPASVPPALIACFVIGSAVVLIASTFVRHIANQRLVALAKGRSLLAIIGAVAGWLTVGVAVLLVAHR